MPKLKLYKGKNGSVVPVEDSIIVIGYQCPWTKNIYQTKKSYLNHLKKLRRNIIQKNIRQKIHDKKKKELFDKSSFDDIIDWIHTNPDFLLYNIKNLVNNYEEIRDDFIVEITKLELSWNDCVKNTHNCPKGGLINFGQLSHIPQGYPGWQGKIEFHVFPVINNGFDILRNMRIFPGSGSGRKNENTGNIVYNCDVKMFSDDWPNLHNGMIYDMLQCDDPNDAKKYIFQKKGIVDFDK